MTPFEVLISAVRSCAKLAVSLKANSIEEIMYIMFLITVQDSANMPLFIFSTKYRKSKLPEHDPKIFPQHRSQLNALYLLILV